MIEAALAVTVILFLIGAAEWRSTQPMRRMFKPEKRLPLERMLDKHNPPTLEQILLRLKAIREETRELLRLGP